MALITNQQDRNQVCQLLTEAVTMLCKNMLPFSNNMCIEGLIGVTTDSTNVILVNIKETITPTCVFADGETPYQMEVDSSHVDNRHKSSKQKRRRSNSSEAEQSQISTVSKREVTPEKPVGRFTPVESAKEKSSSDLEERVKSIKKECDAAPVCTDQYSQVQTEPGESRSSPLQFENSLPGGAIPEWSEYDVSDARPSLTIPESTLLPWSDARHSLEQIHSKEAYELIDETPHMPHPDISFVMGKDRNLFRHPRVAPTDYPKKHGSLSFTIDHDLSGSELFVCECGEPFRHRSSLYRHQMVHLGMAYRCDLCGIIMNRKDNLLTHKRRYCLAQKQLNKSGGVYSK